MIVDPKWLQALHLSKELQQSPSAASVSTLETLMDALFDEQFSPPLYAEQHDARLRHDGQRRHLGTRPQAFTVVDGEGHQVNIIARVTIAPGEMIVSGELWADGTNDWEKSAVMIYSEDVLQEYGELDSAHEFQFRTPRFDQITLKAISLSNQVLLLENLEIHFE